MSRVISRAALVSTLFGILAGCGQGDSLSGDKSPVPSPTPQPSIVTKTAVEPVKSPGLADPGGPEPIRSYYDFGKTSLYVPKFANWNKVTKGMSAENVAKLLGEPLEESEGFEDPAMESWKVYGFIKISDDAFPGKMTFMVFYDKKVVDKKSSIWGDDQIKIADKIPVPVIVSPNNQAFSHYPRYVDIRWNPIPYLKPVFYELEINCRSGGSGAWKKLDENENSDIPFKTITFVGANMGFVRVRAVDLASQEKSEWSEPLNFSFSK